MGTRNLTIMVNNGEYVVAQYGQWDGYPEGQGLTILTALKKFRVEWLKSQLKYVKEYDEDVLCDYVKEVGGTVDEAKNIWKGIRFCGDCDITNKVFKNHPELSRDVGGEIVDMIGNLDCFSDFAVKKNIKFASTTTCEYAYVIDFDKNTFEVYVANYNGEELEENDRFYFLVSKQPDDYPVVLIKTYSLNDLPTDDDFVSELKTLEEERRK